MKVDIVVPKHGMGMAEATLTEWLVGVGDRVAAGDPVASIETDKVEIVIEAPQAGTLVEQLVEPDEDFEVPGVIGRIEAE